MTTEELEVAEQTSDQDELAPLEPGDDPELEAEPPASVGETIEEPDREKMPRFGDPRDAAVAIIRERLDRVLQPVEDDEVWHGVNVITRRDLNEVLALDLPPASIFAAAVRTPAFIYVDAICPVCGIAGEITLEVGVKLIAVASSRKLQLTAKASPLPHQCGQMRIRDVTPTAPVAAGQISAFDGADDSEVDGSEPGADDAVAEADALHALAMTEAPAANPDSDDGSVEPDDLSLLPF